MKHLSIGYRPKCMKTAVRHNSHLLIVSNFFRKSYYNYFFALFILFLSSCIQKDKESKNIFNSATSVTCEEMPIDFMLGVPNQLELIDSLLIIADKVDDGTVVIYDYKNNKLINRILREGQGPEDVILPLQLMVKRKNEIGILQRQNGVYSRYDLSSLLRGSVKSIEKMKFGRIDKMIETSKGYITCGFYEEGGSIGIHDKSGNLTKVIDVYPEYLSIINDISSKYSIGQGSVGLNDNTGVFVFASYFTGEINFYSLSGINDLEKINSYDLNTSHALQNRLQPNDNHILGTDIEHSVDVYTTSDFFYVLYSGISMQERKSAKHSYILQFNSRGEIVNSFKTNQKLVYNICVDENNKTIYGISLSKELDYILVKLNI